MIKKILSIGMVCVLMLALTGCNDDTDEPNTSTNKNLPEAVERPFTESEGLVRYLSIEDIQIAIPLTVREYHKYLEQVGTKVELISNPNSEEVISLDTVLEQGDQSSLKAYFKVYTDNTNYHKFGVHYINNTDGDLRIGEASIDKIILYYDMLIQSDSPQPELVEIPDITCVTNDGDIVLDNDTRSSYIMKILGAPIQNTDGYLTYVDDLGYTYKFATSNLRGTLTQIEITYPE